MIYLDTSVVLAQVFDERVAPPSALWRETLISSRLLAYEFWNRVHARRLPPSQMDEARALLGAINFVELTPAVLARALEPFPVAVATLDGMHLATIEYLRGRGGSVELASYDERLLAAARALRIKPIMI
ncbi:PIN domain-containing protein [Bradyrhizobium sp.]|uniref:PIN domain-containing protein n=1 Tax=Bradyrhizobium sp. TaxID=376 RepID=UPI002E0BFA5E|nr:PIN domain-containing protein [Bradyrhizobium sp.]